MAQASPSWGAPGYAVEGIGRQRPGFWPSARNPGPKLRVHGIALYIRIDDSIAIWDLVSTDDEPMDDQLAMRSGMVYQEYGIGG